jgi:hypothetical protein
MSKNSDMLGSIVRALMGVRLEYLGVILDTCNKLAGSDGSLWYEKIRAILREGAVQVKEVVENTSFLRLLSGAEALPLNACDDTRSLVQAMDVFSAFGSAETISWEGLNVSGVVTPATFVAVHEQVKDGTFRQLFGSLSSNLDKLCLSQGQITMFCQDHHKWLRQDGWATFFLFKEKDLFFVARVSVCSDGLKVFVERFNGRESLWNAAFRIRVVSPQLTAENL